MMKMNDQERTESLRAGWIPDSDLMKYPILSKLDSPLSLPVITEAIKSKWGL